MTKDEAQRISERCWNKFEEAKRHLNGREYEDKNYWMGQLQFWARQCDLYTIIYEEMS